MKKTTGTTKFFLSFIALGCALAFTACSDDENVPQPPAYTATTDMMYGNYTGKMYSYAVNLLDNEEAQTGTDVKANLNDDTIYINNFPIRDIVLSVVGDETLADQIVEAAGDINYPIGYDPKFNEDQDSIFLTLKPEALKLSVDIPSGTKTDETTPMNIEVKVETDTVGNYAQVGGFLKFRFAATEVLLGEGEEQTALPNFAPTTFEFDMTQDRSGL